ncbi:MAG TPA: hypothetical protein VLH79_10650 [Chthonomonadales bacterium]|nr:hypothetical protein [Chthonomonadales bacterium]
MATPPHNPAAELDDAITVDSAALSRVVRRHGLLWLLTAAAATAALLALQLLAVGQAFEATTVLSVQQPGVAAGGALAAFAGAGAQRRHVGILRSRRIAEDVNRAAEIRRLFASPSDKAAVRKIQESMQLRDDPISGLVHVTVSFSGPPLWSRAEERRRLVATAAARTANAYAVALSRYYVEADNERDTVLLRGAEDELRRARQEFDEASARMHQFILRHVGAPIEEPLATGMAGDSTDTNLGVSMTAGTAVAASEVSARYTALAQTEAQLAAALAAKETNERLIDEQLRHMETIPSEDPLLQGVRDRLHTARSALQAAEVQFAVEHPRVVAARARVRAAERDMAQEAVGVRTRRTTDAILTRSEIDGLLAKRDRLQQQIGESESRLRQGTARSADMERMRTDLTLRLDVLKATASEAARLRVGTVSAHSRVTVVDEAVPPVHGRPGAVLMTAKAMAAGLAVVLAWALVAYRREAAGAPRGA